MTTSAEKDAPTDADLAAQVREACDAVGIPYDVRELIRHHRGNAALAATFDALAQQSRERVVDHGSREAGPTLGGREEHPCASSSPPSS